MKDIDRVVVVVCSGPTVDVSLETSEIPRSVYIVPRIGSQKSNERMLTMTREEATSPVLVPP